MPAESANWLAELVTSRNSSRNTRAFPRPEPVCSRTAPSAFTRRRQQNQSVAGGVQQATSNPDLGGELSRMLLKALSSSIVYAAGAPRAAALIPPNFHDDLENDHLPFRQSRDGTEVACEDWRLKASIHQMLGHAPSAQDAAAADSSAGAAVAALLGRRDRHEIRRRRGGIVLDQTRTSGRAAFRPRLGRSGRH